MKYIFIINPNAGKKELGDSLLSKLREYDGRLDYDVYYTKKAKDASNYIDQYCKEHKEDVVFCACGGDGTLNEVVSGAIKYKNAIVTCYPCGSGNDFVKVYGGKDMFLNLENLLNGKEHLIDVMKVNDTYSVNVTNFGFDAAVCNVANNVRRKPLIGGKHSYTTGIFVSLFKSMKTKCKVTIDGEVYQRDKILLSTVSNGQYVGGAYRCAPYSDNEDGLLEVSVVKPINIFKFLTLVSDYKKGTHLDNPKFNNIVTYKRAKRITIEANDDFKICLDGEIYTGPYFEIENLKQALRFIVPSKN